MILLHFALILLHFVLVLHFAAIVITFCGVTRTISPLQLEKAGRLLIHFVKMFAAYYG